MTHVLYGRTTPRQSTNGALPHRVSSTVTGAPQPDGVLNNVVRIKIRHYRQLYVDRSDPIQRSSWQSPWALRVALCPSVFQVSYIRIVDLVSIKAGQVSAQTQLRGVWDVVWCVCLCLCLPRCVCVSLVGVWRTVWGGSSYTWPQCESRVTSCSTPALLSSCDEFPGLLPSFLPFIRDVRIKKDESQGEKLFNKHPHNINVA